MSSAKPYRPGSKKISDAQVKEIKALKDTVKGVELARRYGISKAQISKILNGFQRNQKR